MFGVRLVYFSKRNDYIMVTYYISVSYSSVFPRDIHIREYVFYMCLLVYILFIYIYIDR